MRIRTWIVVASTAMSLALPASAQRKEVMPELDERYIGQLEREVSRFQPISPRTSSRNLFRFALEACEFNWRPDLVEKALEVAEQMQDRDPESRTYGNFRWYWLNDRPHDLNAVEFSMEAGILVWMYHRDKLTPKAAESLERLIRLSIEGIRRHNVPESYTNIYLMKTWNCIAIGENLPAPDLAEEGYEMLDRWLQFTWEAGIHEYISPTYTGVDMPCVALIANHAKRERERRFARAILDYFWMSVAANWYAPAQRLGGAHSRDYDYVTGHGLIEHYIHFNVEGWVDPRPLGTLATFFKYAASTPPQDMIAQLKKPRFIRQSWGLTPWENAAHYLGQSVSIGSAGANYGPMDKILSVNMPGRREEPVVNYLMDARNDPYGQSKFAMGESGHSKALHLQPFVTRVHRGPEVLMLTSTHPSDQMFKVRAPNATCLLSHLVMPYEARMYIGAQGDVVDCVDSMPVGYRPFFIRKQDTAMGVRFLYATSEASDKAPIDLVVEPTGRHALMRLTATHSDQPPQKRATTVLWVRAAEGLDDAGFAAFRKAFADSKAEVSFDYDKTIVRADGLEGEMRLVANLQRGLALERQGEEAKAEERLFAVDGRDFGREILGDLEPVIKHREILKAAKDGGEAVAKAEEVCEAEATPLVVKPFQVGKSRGASGGKFVSVPNNATGTALAKAVYYISIPQDGDYYLHARLLTPTPSDDSYFISVEQNNVPVLLRFAWHTGSYTDWTWATLKKDANPMALPLKKGPAKVTFHCREDGSQLDAFTLSKKSEWSD